jgi:aryl-alcohol dehydrogenase-like predicted oxidoreductase
MDVTRTAFGVWNGGCFVNYGEPLSDEHWIELVRRAYEKGVRTFITADVYGEGAADELLGRALAGLPRSEYCLIGAVGHDFYKGRRQGARGYPRFTDPGLRPARDYGDYLRMATDKSLQRCRAEKFDLLLLQNPDSTGYGQDKVWVEMDKLREAKLTDRIGIAPGPGNGFTLDLILCLERFGVLLDWAMILLNPLEPWPGRLVLPAAAKYEVNLLTRMVDHGGIFHDDIKPGRQFALLDYRAARPAGWVETALEKMDNLRPIALKYNLTPLQLACIWNLSQPPVKSVAPALIQETGGDAKPVETQADELAGLPDVVLTRDECEFIAQTGDNRGAMPLQGANRAHTAAAEADRWGMTADLEGVGRRWGIDPGSDLAYSRPAGR